MKCPACIAVDLLMSERQGIEIDYCPSCRGVWLDRGELDKFIQRANLQAPVPSSERFGSREREPEPGPRALPRNDEYDRRQREHEYRDEDRYNTYRGKKKESFWKELFDFD